MLSAVGKQSKRKMDDLVGNSGKTELCLVMIVKNEATVIERLIDSVKGHISSWCIVDTGSTDGTQDLIREALFDLPGRLIEEPWIDFATNRTQALTASKVLDADWLLLMDADWTAEFSENFEEELDKFASEQAMIMLVGEVEYRLPKLVRANHPWRYVGRVHEHITSDTEFDRAPFDHLVLNPHSENRDRRPSREAQDIKFLNMDLADNPENGRTVFYLAQTYKDMGKLGKAIKYYKQRVAMGGWDEETYYAQYQIGVLQDKLNNPDAVLSLETAWEMRPQRAEAACHLARHHRIAGNIRLAWLWSYAGYSVSKPEDLLFVDNATYEWYAAFEYADALWRNGTLGLAKTIVEEALSCTTIPAEYFEHLMMILADIVERMEQ